MSSYEVVPLRAFTRNCIWMIRDASHAAVVDPGDARPAFDYLPRGKLQLAAVINTHHHANHDGGNAALTGRGKVPVCGPHDARIPDVTQRLADGERIALPHFGLELPVGNAHPTNHDDSAPRTRRNQLRNHSRFASDLPDL